LQSSDLILFAKSKQCLHPNKNFIKNKAGETYFVSFGTLLLAIKWPYSFRKEKVEEEL
jgi:hypothetical protein